MTDEHSRKNLKRILVKIIAHQERQDEINNKLLSLAKLQNDRIKELEDDYEDLLRDVMRLDGCEE